MLYWSEWSSEMLAGESERGTWMWNGKESGWKETNSGKKVQFGERERERLLNHGCQMAKFDSFLSLDFAPTPSTLAQSKERKGSNFAA